MSNILKSILIPAIVAGILILGTAYSIPFFTALAVIIYWFSAIMGLAMFIVPDSILSNIAQEQAAEQLSPVALVTTISALTVVLLVSLGYVYLPIVYLVSSISVYMLRGRLDAIREANSVRHPTPSDV